MKKSNTTITADEWIREVFPDPEKPPAGALTIEQVMQKLKRCKATVDKVVSEKVRSGKLIRKRFFVNGSWRTYVYPKNKNDDKALLPRH